jgi:hypothetical protein
MERQLREERGVRPGIARLQDLGDPSVHSGTAIHRQLVVQRLADEIVGEPVPARHAGHRLKQARLHRLADEIDRTISWLIRDGPEDIETEFGPDDGCQRERPRRRVTQVADTTSDDGADAGRYCYA